MNSKPTLVLEEDLVCGFCGSYWTVSWSEMEWDGPPAESAAVIVTAGMPVGAPGLGGAAGLADGDEAFGAGKAMAAAGNSVIRVMQRGDSR